MHTQTFFTHEEVAAVVGEPASKLRTWISRGVIVPQAPARWSPGEMLLCGIFCELVREQMGHGEAAQLANAILQLAVTGKPAGGRAEGVFIVEMLAQDGERTLRVCYKRETADRVVNILLKRNPVSLRLRDFSDLFQRVRQAREVGAVELGEGMGTPS